MSLHSQTLQPKITGVIRFKLTSKYISGLYASNIQNAWDEVLKSANWKFLWMNPKHTKTWESLSLRTMNKWLIITQLSKDTVYVI